MEEIVKLLKNTIFDIQSKIEQYNNINSKLSTFSTLESIIKIDKDDIKIIESCLSDSLLPEELKIMQDFSIIPSDDKEFFISLGLDDSQKQIINSILNKISKKVANNNINELKDIKASFTELLTNVNSPKSIIFPTSILLKLFAYNSIPIDKQILLLKEINQKNISLIDESKDIDSQNGDIIFIDDLAVVNLDENKIIELFNKFSIDWKKIPRKYQEKLLKYGNYETIEEILLFLVSNNFNKLLTSDYEVLTKILILSDVKKLSKLIDIVKKYPIFKSTLDKFPTILFPRIRERIAPSSKKPGNTSNYVESGAYDTAISNVLLLEELGIPLEYVSSKCPSYFVWGTAMIRKNLNSLRLYGLNIDKNNYEDNSLYILRSSGKLLDRLDVWIECGGYSYIINNLSRLANSYVNPYRIKLFDKLQKLNIISDNETAFGKYKNKNGIIKLSLKRSFYDSEDATYGKTELDTFSKYGAQELPILNKKYFDEFFNKKDNVSIESIVSNPIVIQLDELYYSDLDPLVYSFQGVTISRNKVLRYLQSYIDEKNCDIDKDILLYSISIRSMLDENEINSINQCINKIDFSRSKRYDRKY